MISLRISACTVAAAIAFATPALAVDLKIPKAPPLEPETPIFVGGNSGWYLRGDFGYRWQSIADAAATAPFTTPTANTLANTMWAGAGAGIKARWLRADLTLDYAPTANYTGTTPAGDITTKIDSISALFNVYFDLGTWWGLTPYVGGGVGTAYLRTSDVTGPGGVTTSGAGKWNLAYGAMAGTSYALGRNLAVDLGYRYLHLGDATNDGGTITFKNINAHEVRLGVRWMFNDAVTIP